jgi:DNA-directed RNA polymerase subunit RPC12/RpoP
MLKGSCVKCGRKYYGWALQGEEYRVCNQCGGKLHVTQKSGATKTKGGIKMDETKKKKGVKEISGERAISRRKFIKKMAYAAPVVMTFIASRAHAKRPTPCRPAQCKPVHCKPSEPCHPGHSCPPRP